MKFLYVNNIRGFSETIIPIKKVNFLVGENSTGKSSILNILKIITEPEFLISKEFIDEEYFGSFDEIVSNKSKNKSSFEIGFISFDDKGTDHIIQLYTFKNNKGKPELHKYSFNKNNNIITSIIYKNHILLLKKSSTPFENFDSLKNEFLNITKEHSNRSTGYIKISNKGLPKHILLSSLAKIVDSEQNKNDDIKSIFDKVTIQSILPPTTWIAPIRATPQRIYDGYSKKYSASGDHIPGVLNKFIGQKKPTKRQSMLQRKLNDFGSKSGLFEKITINRFGNNSYSPFEINLIINETAHKVTNVGYGVSQVLPIITELFYTGNTETIAIQQPEVHLHPKAQALLGQFLYNTASNNPKNTYFIETHSDYLIDRFRLSIARDDAASDEDHQVLFFERCEYGNQIHPISICDKGKYTTDQPDGFRDFFINEELNLLEI